MLTKKKRTYWENYILDSVFKMESFVRNLEFRFENFKVTTETNWKKNEFIHWGGINDKDKPAIWINLRSFWIDNNIAYEFKKYSKKKDIFKFKHFDRKVRIDAALAHEIAHAICIYYFDNEKHNKQWQYYYRILRRKFINDRLK